MKMNFSCHYYVVMLLEIQNKIFYQHDIEYRVN